jgi:long-subunit fatty acid transport protein
MTRVRRLPLLLAAFLALPTVAWGAGFSLYEQGARALGSAGAYTARVNDASGIYYNPAGLAKVESGEFQVGTSFIYVTREFAGVEPIQVTACMRGRPTRPSSHRTSTGRSA